MSGGGHRPGPDRIDLLVGRTSRRLATLTLLLVASLLLSVGAVTAVVASRLMHENVDRSLEATSEAVQAREVSEDAEDAAEGGEHPPAGSDTFVLLLDSSGEVTGNPSRIRLEGLPDLAAVAAAGPSGRDLRDGTYGGVHVRLLTERDTAAAGSDTDGDDEEDADESGDDTADERVGTAGWVQAGFVMTLHDEQEAQLLAAIALAAVAGLVGAALVTLVVTRRALVPVRAAFAVERRFVASASHELRTPLAIIRASAEIMEREGLVIPDGRALLSDVTAEADRMSRLVNDLLALASAEGTTLTVVRRPLELTAWMREHGRRAESMATARGLVTVTSVEGVSPVIVEADDDRLTQLLMILVDNAIEHSPAGGTIGLGLTVARGHAVVSVTDQGPGVPEAEREHIFEPFARLPGQHRDRSGSGLGLAIARQLAARHGAELSVGDAPGGGARFALRLPLAPPGP